MARKLLAYSTVSAECGPNAPISAITIRLLSRKFYPPRRSSLLKRHSILAAVIKCVSRHFERHFGQYITYTNVLILFKSSDQLDRFERPATGSKIFGVSSKS